MVFTFCFVIVTLISVTLSSDPIQEPVNLATLDKSATASTHPKNAAYALHPGFHDCYFSALTYYPWWQVDLKGFYMINSVVITKSTAADVQFDISVDVYKNDPDRNSGELVTACGAHDGVFPETSTSIQCPENPRGRYVRIKSTYNSALYLSLCQVEVYGQETSKTCSQFERLHLGRSISGSVTHDVTVQRCANECHTNSKCITFAYSPTLRQCVVSLGPLYLNDVNPLWNTYSLRRFC